MDRSFRIPHWRFTTINRIFQVVLEINPQIRPRLNISVCSLERSPDLADDKANVALAGVISALARKNTELLELSRPFARGIQDGRLAMEVDLIQTIAADLTRLLKIGRAHV